MGESKQEKLKVVEYFGGIGAIRKAFERLDIPFEVVDYVEIDEFAELWNSTVKESDIEKYGWKANPWVWVVDFERYDKPEII